MTGARNPDDVATYPPTAHIPGLGPKDATCAGCGHFIKASRPRNGRCFLWAQFRGLGYRLIAAYRAEHADWWHGLQTIPRTTLACKYWNALS